MKCSSKRIINESNSSDFNDEEQTNRALDNFVHKPQQTYEEFVGLFSYLNQESQNGCSDITTVTDTLFKKKLMEKEELNNVEPNKHDYICSSEKNNHLKVQFDAKENEEIDTEFADMSSVCNSHFSKPLKDGYLQLNNYVEESCGSDDDEASSLQSSYVASFNSQDDNDRSVSNHKIHLNKSESESINNIKTKPETDVDRIPLFPGEITPDIPVPHYPSVNTTNLSFRSQPKLDRPIIQEETQSCNPSVTTFCLDSDFDYENVSLSCKFQLN